MNTELSVIVTVVGGAAFVRRCLRSLMPQTAGRFIEILVPFDASAVGLDELRHEFSDVRFLDLGIVETAALASSRAADHEMYDRRRAAGLAAARGDVIAIIEDFETVAEDWVDQVLAAHRLPHGVIGGAVEHAGRGVWNWAVYFLDFGRYALPLAEGPADYLTDVNVSYKREALESVRHLWAERYHEVTVHWELARRGVTLWRRPQMVVYQDRGPLKLLDLLSERLAWGRLFAALRVRELSPAMRVVHAALCPVLPLVLLDRAARKVIRGRRNVGQLFRALPSMTVLSTAWCIGEFLGYLTGRDAGMPSQIGRPAAVPALAKVI